MKTIALFRSVASFLLIAGVAQVDAQWHTVGNVDSYRWDSKLELTVRAGTAVLAVRALTEDCVRIRMSPTGSFTPDRSWAVVKTAWDPVRVEITDSADRLVLSTRALDVVVRKKPLRIAFYDPSGKLLNSDDSLRGISWTGTQVCVWKSMPPGEEYLGFGEKAGLLPRSGTHVTMWNSDIPGYTADTDPLYESIPFFLALREGRAYGIFFDNTFRSSFDMGKECRDAYSFGAEAGEINYYFFAGAAPRAILSRFTELVGRMPLPPRWALGYQQCRWSYPTETRVKEIARGFRERKIPCDVIYLDIDYMDGYRIFTWNRKNFPDPSRMIADLANDGFKIAVIVDPGIKVDSNYSAFRSGLAGNQFVRYPDGRLYRGKVWPGVCAFPDFTSERARSWWGSNFAGLVHDGVRGWWNDMNEPSVFDVPTKTIDLDVVHDDDGQRTAHAKNHNIYGMQMTRATREGVQQLAPEERVFVLTRASFAGGQRYSAAWTGDNVATWEHLGLALRMCLNLSVSGQPFVGSDIGGFIGYPSGELFARWLQLGVFTPLMRAHSVINEKNKEPWEYGPEFTDVNRETINLRYRFLPYIYNAMVEASLTGVPPMQPLGFAFPAESNLLYTDDEFMFGGDLLVAPVLDEGGRRRSVQVPRGTWYDFWSDSSYGGGQRIDVGAPLNRLPLLVRAGAILPLQQIVQYSDEAPINPLTFSFYPVDSTNESSTVYYEDDGHTMKYRDGDFMRRTVLQRRSQGALDATFTACEGSYRPPERSLILEFHGCTFIPDLVLVNGTSLPRATAGQFSGATRGWSFDAAKKVMGVKLPESPQRIEVRVKYRE
jgi:alpha-glucosidase